jgi:hypothetical protein
MNKGDAVQRDPLTEFRRNELYRSGQMWPVGPTPSKIDRLIYYQALTTQRPHRRGDRVTVKALPAGDLWRHWPRFGQRCHEPWCGTVATHG